MWSSVVLAFVSLPVSILLAYPLRRAGVLPTEYLVNERYVKVRNATYYGEGPHEEASAMCSVLTHDVNAKANATISKRIYGVATPNDINKAVQRIEQIIQDEIQMLWQNIDALRMQVLEKRTVPYRRHMSFRLKPGSKDYWRK